MAGARMIDQYDYEDDAAFALEELTFYQQGTIVLSRTVAGEVDPAAPWVEPAATLQSETLIGVASGVSEEFVDNTAIVASDIEVRCVPPAMGVMATDTVTIDGKATTILAIKPMPAAGLAVVQRLIVKG